MPKKQEEKSEVFYVGVKDPIELRRSLLESSKEMIQYLQRFERFKQVRAEKEAEVKKLRENMHEIHALVRKLKTALPKTKLRTKMHKHEEEIAKIAAIKAPAPEPKAPKAAPKKEEPAPAPQPVKPPKRTELERLEDELSEIEGRLTKLV